MAPPSSPLDEPTKRRLARVLEEEAGWAPEATAGLGTAEEAVRTWGRVLSWDGREIGSFGLRIHVNMHARTCLQVCALVQGLFAPQITPRLLSAVDNRVTVLLGGGDGAGAGGRCVGRVLFGTEEDGEDEDGGERPIFPR